jgi:hypothetical protein
MMIGVEEISKSSSTSRTRVQSSLVAVEVGGVVDIPACNFVL